MRGWGVPAPPLPTPPGAAALDTGSACVAGALAFALVARAVRRLPIGLGSSVAARAAAGRRATGTSRIALCASKEASFDVPGIGSQPVNSKRKTPPGGNWMFPVSDIDENDMGDQKPDVPPKISRPPETPKTFAVWIARRKDLPALLASWAEAAEDDKTRALLARLAAEEVPKEWGVWGISDGDDTPGGGGFYIVPPREPKALVLLEPVDEEVNNIQHIAVSPKDQGPAIRKAVEDWLASLKPKRAVICRPEELELFSLEVLAGDAGTKVSKGL